jgi:hypothetical protein
VRFWATPEGCSVCKQPVAADTHHGVWNPERAGDPVCSPQSVCQSVSQSTSRCFTDHREAAGTRVNKVFFSSLFPVSPSSPSSAPFPQIPTRGLAISHFSPPVGWLQIRTQKDQEGCLKEVELSAQWWSQEIHIILSCLVATIKKKVKNNRQNEF